MEFQLRNLIALFFFPGDFHSMKRARLTHQKAGMFSASLELTSVGEQRMPTAKGVSVAMGTMGRPLVQRYLNQFQLTSVVCSGQYYGQQ